jgi:hypothetical protein
MSAILFQDIPRGIPQSHLVVALIPNTKIPKIYQNYGFERFCEYFSQYYITKLMGQY